MPDTPQVTVRTTETGRVTEVVVPHLDGFDAYNGGVIAGLVQDQIPNAEVWLIIGGVAIRQPSGPDVVALAGETLRIAQGRVERVREDEVA